MRDLQGFGFSHTQEFSKKVGDSQEVGFKGFFVFTHTHTQNLVQMYY